MTTATACIANDNFINILEGKPIQKLRAAVASMQFEVAGMKANVAEFHPDMVHLKANIGRLETSLFKFHKDMANISMKRLRRKSLRLAATAERWAGGA
jgi:hypothetical protein